MCYQANLRCLLTIIVTLCIAEGVTSKSVLRTSDARIEDLFRNDDVLAVVIRNTRLRDASEKEFSESNNEPNLEQHGVGNINGDDDDDDEKESSVETDETGNRVNEDCFAELSNKPLGLNLLRSWKKCNRSAAKMCNKACRSAVSNVCSMYSCSRKSKKAFKRECKVVCESNFEGDYS